MADYIDRGKYCDAICHCDQNYCDKPSCPIWKAPSEDVALVVHGKWRWVGEDKWNDCYECTVCGKMHTDNSSFCPNCGAKMDAEQEEPPA